MSRPRFLLLVCACLCWHALDLASHWRQAHRDQTGRDFASYYYAVDVALNGGDPYERSALGAASRDEGTRRGVHPFFYPPPYLVTMLWVAPLDLVTAYRAWFWLDELFALLALLVLWRWFRPLGSSVGAVLAVSLAAFTGLPNNHLMGQMNLPVFLLALVALQREEDGEDGVAGMLMGLACMMKMSPAFFVAWWMLRRRWRAVGASILTAIALSALSLPLVPFDVQWGFFTEVLPAFGSGSYNGLGVGIDLFGNHSLPNLYDDAFPAGPAHLVLSDTARVLSTVTMVTVVVVLGLLLRARPADLLATGGQIGAVGVSMLLVPVITYEHHLVWTLPAMVVAVAALERGRLSGTWAPLVGAAIATIWFDLAEIKDLWSYVRVESPVLAWCLRELKLAAMLVLLFASVRVGRSAPPDPT